jgi:DNA polymerase-3 subunit epsilon
LYLFYDTETTGFPDYKLSLDNPENARVVQLACLLLDEKFNERACFATIIKPAGWTINPGAQQAHGISLELCQEYGIEMPTVLSQFEAMVSRADILIAHNKKFDHRMMSVELALANRALFDFPDTHCHCTMESTTNLCRLPSKIPGKYKWPKLHEAYSYIFHEELKGAHDALVDCRATARIYQFLVQNKIPVS